MAAHTTTVPEIGRDEDPFDIESTQTTTANVIAVAHTAAKAMRARLRCSFGIAMVPKQAGSLEALYFGGDPQKA